VIVAVTTAPSPNVTLVSDFLAAMGRVDIPALSELLADDASWWLGGDMPVSGLYEGKDAVIGGFLASAAALFEPGSLGFNLRVISDAGDRVIVEYAGIARGAATGKDYNNAYCTIFECREGKIHTVREYLDTAHAREVLYSVTAS
jgi:hypothetical protein